MMKKLLSSAALAASLFALSAPASATLTNWFIDTDGPGGNAAVQVSDWLDLTGTAYVHNSFDPMNPTNFTFNEVGNFNVFSADGGTVLTPSISAAFVGSGSGSVGGPLNFNPGGSLNVFSGATNIANFVLLTGSANLNAGTVLPNGAISFVFDATSMLAGYFFDEFMNDLATVVAAPGGLVMGFATTNVINSNVAIPGALVTSYNAAFDPDVVAPVSNGTTDLFLSNNGQFRLAVPEPSILSLLGLALIGLGFTSRRKTKV
jgi:hypothetical protein